MVIGVIAFNSRSGESLHVLRMFPPTSLATGETRRLVFRRTQEPLDFAKCPIGPSKKAPVGRKHQF